MFKTVSDQLSIGPLRVLRLGSDDLVTRVLGALEPGQPPLAVAFCNTHAAETALRNAEFAAALEKFVVINDGVGIEIAARILEGRGFPENLNGTDFLPTLFDSLTQPAGVYLLGARPGVAEEAGRKFAARFPMVRIAGVRDGYFLAQDEDAVVAAIAAARPDILLVAFGNPKQELFIARHFDALGAKTMFGVGALLDFTAGRVVRAPQWVRRSRLEWAFRLAQEPGRLVHRYTIEAGRFLFAVLKLKFAADGRKTP